MDSINLTYLRYKVVVAKNNQFKVKLALLETELQAKDLELQAVKTDNNNLKQQKSIYQKRIDNLILKHQTEIDMYQAKQQNKIWWFLGGSAFGALLVMFLSMI